MLVVTDVSIEYVKVLIQEAAWQVIPKIHENRDIMKNLLLHTRKFAKEKFGTGRTCRNPIWKRLKNTEKTYHNSSTHKEIRWQPGHFPLPPPLYKDHHGGGKISRRLQSIIQSII